MLPPQLKKIQTQLITKGYNNRSVDEDTLLKELEAIDKSFRSNQITENEFSERVEKALGGPLGSCPCCGKYL